MADENSWDEHHKIVSKIIAGTLQSEGIILFPCLISGVDKHIDTQLDSHIRWLRLPAITAIAATIDTSFGSLKVHYVNRSVREFRPQAR